MKRSETKLKRIKIDEDNFCLIEYKCLKCQSYFHGMPQFKYCPYCGKRIIEKIYEEV